MDTGKLMARQLRYCRAGAETPQQIAQIEWWQSKIAALRAEQPLVEPVPAGDQAPELQATGTEGGR